jgi:hypothetical protein
VLQIFACTYSFGSGFSARHAGIAGSKVLQAEFLTFTGDSPLDQAWSVSDAATVGDQVLN